MQGGSDLGTGGINRESQRGRVTRMNKPGGEERASLARAKAESISDIQENGEAEAARASVEGKGFLLLQG